MLVLFCDQIFDELILLGLDVSDYIVFLFDQDLDLLVSLTDQVSDRCVFLANECGQDFLFLHLQALYGLILLGD